MRFFYVRHKGEMMKDEAYLKMLGTAVWESPVPIYIIHVEVDEAGKPVDWRFACANEAEARHLSIPLEKLIGSDSGAETKTASAPALSKQSARPMHPESATIKFEDLKFGRNYDPTSSK